MPEAVLAAVVFVIGIDLVDVEGMRKIFVQRRSEFWVALITALMVVFVGVEQGILLAIAVADDHKRRGYRPKNAVLVRFGSGVWQAQPVATKAQAVSGLLVYRFTHGIYYANTPQLTAEIMHLVNSANPPLRWFCIDASAVDDVDFTAAEALRAIFASLKGKGVRLVVAQVLADVAAESRYQLWQLFGEDAFYATLDNVLHDFSRVTRP